MERKVYDEQFKIDAVNLLTSSGKSFKDAGKELGVHPALLSKWKKEWTSEKSVKPSSRVQRRSPVNKEIPMDAENERLKKENAELRDGLKTLKKTMAIFLKYDEL